MTAAEAIAMFQHPVKGLPGGWADFDNGVPTDRCIRKHDPGVPDDLEFWVCLSDLEAILAVLTCAALDEMPDCVVGPAYPQAQFYCVRDGGLFHGSTIAEAVAAAWRAT